MLIESSVVTSVRKALERDGFEQLLAVGAVPVNNALGVRYSVRVTARGDGSEWYLRAFGADFDLMAPQAQRWGGRWFSVGWGIAEGIQVPDLLLIQVNRCTEAQADVLGEQIERQLGSVCTAMDTSATRVLGHTCLRVSAVLEGEASPAWLMQSTSGR